jgi:hypothetical protein
MLSKADSMSVGIAGVAIRCFLYSCTQRQKLRHATIKNLASTDWGSSPIVELDESSHKYPLQRQLELARRTLRRAVHEVMNEGDEFILLLEDDQTFNRNLRHNLRQWDPIRRLARGQHFFATLYNPGLTFLKLSPEKAYGEVSPPSFMGSQALLVSRCTAHFLLTFWGTQSSTCVDRRFAQLASKVCPLLCHVPSLVQHVGTISTWGGPFHHSPDYDENWKAPEWH